MRMIKMKDMLREDMPREKEDFEHEAKQGYLWGKKDARTGYERDLENFPPAFVKGYKKAKREGWWDRMNSKMTDLLARMGSSRLR